MSNKDSEVSAVSSKEDIELKEFTRNPENYSESSASPELKDSCRWSTAQTQTEFFEDEAYGSAITFLNTSGGNRDVLDMDRVYSRSLEEVSSDTGIRNSSFSLDKQDLLIGKGSLTRSASPPISLDRLSHKSTSPPISLDAYSNKSASPPVSLDRFSNKSASSVSLDRFSNKSASPPVSMDRLSHKSASHPISLDRLSKKSASHPISLERLSKKSASPPISPDRLSHKSVSHPISLDRLSKKSASLPISLDRLSKKCATPPISLDRLSKKNATPPISLERLSKKNASYPISLHRLSKKSASPQNSLDRLCNKSASLPISLDRHSNKSASPLNSLEGHSISTASCLDPPDESLSGIPSRLDPLEGPESTYIPNFLVGHSTERAFQDPLEGPSTRTVWFLDSVNGSSPHSETETNEISNNESPTEQNGYWFRTTSWLESFLRRRSRQIRHSAYFPLFQVALLVIPFSAVYMSSKYSHLCRGCPGLPVLMYLFAIFGLFIIIIRISSVLSQRYFSPHLTGREFHSFMMGISLAYFFFQGVAMFATYNCEPDFIHPGSEEFCIKVFYDYAYQVNIAASLVILLMCLINIPALYDESEDE